LQETLRKPVQPESVGWTKLLDWYKRLSGGIDPTPAAYDHMQAYVQGINLYHTRIVCFIILCASLLFLPSDLLFLNSSEQFQKLMVWRITSTSVMALGWFWFRFVIKPADFALWKWGFACVALCVGGCSIAAQLGPFDEPWVAVFLLAPFSSVYMVMKFPTRFFINTIIVLTGLLSIAISAPVYLTYPFFPTFAIYAILGLVVSTAAGWFLDSAARENFTHAATLKQKQKELHNKVAIRTAQVNEAFQQLEASQEQVREEVSNRLQDELGHLLHRHQQTLQQVLQISELAQQGQTFLEQLGKIEEATQQVVNKAQVAEELSLKALQELYGHLRTQQLGFTVEWVIEPKDVELSPEQGHVFSRILKEAFTNIRKHAQANKAVVTVKDNTKRLLLSIQDDGVGFESDSPTNRHGLKGLKERGQELGATFELNSSPGAGTELRFAIDKKPKEPSPEEILPQEGVVG